MAGLILESERRAGASIDPPKQAYLESQDGYNLATMGKKWSSFVKRPIGLTY
jgi:hypothetical protein